MRAPLSPQSEAANGVGLPLHDEKDNDKYPVDLLSPTLLSVGWQSTFVTPSIPIAPECMKLSPLDQMENRFILPTVLVFHVSSPALRQSLLQNLKIGLAKMIEELSFLAGDVIPDCEEQGTVQLQISENAGVWFHSQELPGIDYYALERRNFPPSAFPLLSLMPEPRVHHPKRSPVLTLLASFINDGLVLTTNYHHAVMDASAVFTMVKRLAKHVAASTDGRIISPDDGFPEEALDRSNVFGGSGRKEVCDFPNYRLGKTYRSAVERELMEAALAEDHPKRQLMQKLELSHWFISDNSMQSMREAAFPLSEGLPVLTDHTILSAVLWRRISRARQLSSRGIMTTSFMTTVNVRRRMDPPLPLDYAGNAVIHAKTSAATADMESTEPGTLYNLAKQITDAIEWWTPERIRDLIGAIESNTEVSKIEPNMDNFLGSDVEVSSAASMGDVSSSYWGCELQKLKAVRYGYARVKDGWISILPQGNDGGIDLLIGLEKSTLDRLRQDTEWLQLAQESL
ncbi:transferase [Aspergillus ambiguus]|uniref:transferase n=1 Tax=Aspergillus ambiguus TaxID=176160 RepID=UPI003CCDC530